MGFRRWGRPSRLGADGLLLTTAFLWGVTFVAQKYAAATMPALAFVAARFAVSAVVLAPFALWEFRRKPHRPEPRRMALRPGIGLTLFFGTTLQQAGIETTSATNAGFLTACYVVDPLCRLGAHRRASTRNRGGCGIGVAHWRLAARFRGRARPPEWQAMRSCFSLISPGRRHRADADLSCPLRPAVTARLCAICGLRRPCGAVLPFMFEIDPRQTRWSPPCRRFCSPASSRARSPTRSR